MNFLFKGVKNWIININLWVDNENILILKFLLNKKLKLNWVLMIL